ncbi:hypothetical protein G6F43_000100 [Rhizopus delemar]|nr:hypothetical protein G6F43_000100 [Rhizopus delemar]
MSLLLTKSCEYALLVTIQQGQYFEYDNYSIKVETELDLKLPCSVDDLIPQDTLISSPSANIQTNGTCTFNVSLVYFLSTKQLIRLRREGAATTLSIKKVFNDSLSTTMDKIQLSVSEAKEVIPKSAHHLDHIYKFVADKGDWCKLSSGNEQLKLGLFYVAMPDTATTNSTSRVNTPCIELRSPPPTPKITNTIVNNTLTRKKNIASILGTHPKKKSNNNKKTIKSAEQQPQPKLNKKTSLMDLNIEELSEMLRKINIFTDTQPQLQQKPKDIQKPYHQIGKGSLKYTFYFKVLQADHINHTILRSSNLFSKLKRPYVTWSFLSTYNISPAASYSTDTVNQSRSCYQLSGHLVDIQNWLDSLGQMKLSLIMMDKHTKQTAGTGTISLRNIAFTDKTFDDRTCLIHNTAGEVMAKVTVRLGLVSGWHQEYHPDTDNWDMLQQQKRVRPSSQSSSLPTLTTSTSVFTKSTVPTVHHIIPNMRPSSSITSYFNKRRDPIK